MKPDFKNILVIQTAFIGDAILASSVVEKLHAFFPQAAISILVRKGNESLYEKHPFLKETLVWNKQQGKYASLFALRREIRKRKFDAVINLHRFLSSGFLTASSGAWYSAGYKQNLASFFFNTTVKHVIGDGRHETERYNQLIEDITDKNVFKPKLYPSPAQVEKVKAYKTLRYICMAPSSVWFTKQLPKEKWMELCNKMDRATTIYLLGAPGDKALCEEIKTVSEHPAVVNLAGELALLESCALMKNAAMNYVNDSAPLHLASAVNAPVTAFFCSTVPAYGFGPLSDSSTVVEVKGLPCKPCGLHGYKVCPLGHFKCGHEIVIS
ncbi:MAG: glycosyltransferase family 9 protein [Bacteroidia bacterium]